MGHWTQGTLIMDSPHSVSPRAQLLQLSFTLDQRPRCIPLCSEFLHTSESESSFEYNSDEECAPKRIPASPEVPKLEGYLYSGSATPCSTRSGSASPQFDSTFDCSKLDQSNLALLRAVQSGNWTECFQLLNGTAQTRLRTIQKDSLLHIAARTGDATMCAGLLSHGLLPDLNWKNESGQTPLHVACGNGHLDAAKTLVKAGAALSELDSEGNTPMHCAAIAHHFDIAKYLRLSGAEATLRNKQGKTAIECQTMKTLKDLRKTVQSSSWRIPATIRYKLTPQPHFLRPSDFQLVAMLGKGSFGEVYLARERATNQRFALKVMKKEKVLALKMTKYAFTERNVLCRVKTPLIVGLYAAFQNAENLFLALDYCPGGDLAKYLERERRFSEDRAKIYVAEMLLAIEELHRHDILYRDLKPENIVLAEDGHCVLTDFGLSKEGVSDNFSAHSFCGSLGYIAPEMLRKQGHGKAVDWYMLGILLYELLTGKLPYYSRDRDTLFKNIERGKLTFPEEVGWHARGLLLGVRTMQLLCRDPQKRLGSGPTGAAEIKSHPFFAAIDWAHLPDYRLPAPERPELFTRPIPPETQLLTTSKDDAKFRVPGWEFLRQTNAHC